KVVLPGVDKDDPKTAIPIPDPTKIDPTKLPDPTKLIDPTKLPDPAKIDPGKLAKDFDKALEKLPDLEPKGPPKPQEKAVLKLPGAAGKLAISGDGKTFAVVVSDSKKVFDGCQVQVYDLPSLERKKYDIPGFTKGASLAMSPDGKTLAVGAGNTFGPATLK